MSGRAIIFIVAGTIIISAIILYNIEAASTSIVANFDNAYLSETAQNIAQSGVNMGLHQLSEDRAWRTGFPLMNLLTGQVLVNVFDTTFTDIPVVAVRATGTSPSGGGATISATSTA